MKNAILSGLSPFGKLMVTGFIVLSSFILSFVIGVLISMLVFKFNFFQSAYIFSDLDNPDNINILKFFQIIQSLGIFIIPPFLLGYLFENSGSKYLSISVKPKLATVFYVAAIMIFGIPLINLLSELNASMSLPDSFSGLEEWMRKTEMEAQRLTEAFVNTATIWGVIVNVFMIAVIPGIGEELLFRGVLQKIFIDLTKRPHVGIILTAILFSAMHMQFFGFFPRFLMGLFFGYIYYWSGSIWLPIIAHFVNNCAAVIFSYLAANEVVNKNLETIGNSPETMVWAISSLIITILLIFLIYKKERRNSSKPI